MACGSDVDDDAVRCKVCGADRDPEVLHEGSDVRLEVERLGEALPNKDLSLPAGRWGRASEHPRPDPEGLRAYKHIFEAEPTRVESERPPAAQESEAAAETPRVEAPPAAAATPPSHGEDSGPRAVAPHEEVSLASLVTPPTEVRHGTGGHPAALVRPPVLASEALQRDLTPAEPSPRLLRFWCPVLGLLGVCATWFLTHGRGLGAPLCGAFAALALLGLPRMGYSARAGAVATVAATGLALVLWADEGTEAGPRAVVLTLAVTLLATGLLFRSWHRASVLSRFMVALGILLGVSFLWMSEAFNQLTLLDTTWQSWAPILIALPFGILLMLSLLVFMNARTTAGAGAWACFVLLWYALHATVEMLHAVWPKDAESPDFSRVDLQTLLAWGSAPIFSALLTLALAQLIASALARSAGTGPARRTAYFEPSH
ncbi:MAG TPA: hypothetical protein VJV78_43340 [Polyangiales bacterium]|nr:hypothetical protein [Polyangiales bacterium]